MPPGDQFRGTPGWFLLMLPLALATTLLLLAQVVNPWLRHRVMGLSRYQHALIDFAKFIAAAVCTVALPISSPCC